MNNFSTFLNHSVAPKATSAAFVVGEVLSKLGFKLNETKNQFQIWSLDGCVVLLNCSAKRSGCLRIDKGETSLPFDATGKDAYTISKFISSVLKLK